MPSRGAPASADRSGRPATAASLTLSDSCSSNAQGRPETGHAATASRRFSGSSVTARPSVGAAWPTPSRPRFAVASQPFASMTNSGRSACSTRRMVETAAHLADHVLPRLPVRQWLRSVPKRRRQAGGSRDRVNRRDPTTAPSATPSRSSEGIEEAPGEVGAILRRAARYAWALLLARIHEVFPLVCPRCGGEMRIIAFITDAGAVCDFTSSVREDLQQILDLTGQRGQFRCGVG